MPLTLILTEGVIPQELEQATMARLTNAFLELHGLAGNAFIVPNAIGLVHTVPRGRTYAGGSPTPLAVVEWKVPSFAFTTRDVQIAYVERATAIIHEMSGGTHPKEKIWVNVTHAVDGPYGIAGAALTNAEMGGLAAKG